MDQAQLHKLLQNGKQMPIYEFKCESCHITQEIERSIHAESNAPVCTNCGELMGRVYVPIPAQFKGEGWGFQ